MNYKLIKNIWIDRKQLENSEIDDTITITKDDFTFTGESILSNDTLSKCIKGNDETYAILLKVDGWSKTNDFNVVIFQCLDSSIDDLIYDIQYEILGADAKVQYLTEFFSKIKESFKTETVSNSSIPAAPNSSTFRAMVSGEIDVREKYTHYGDYNSRSYIATGIQVGSGIERETSCLIQAITKLATEFVSDKITNGTSKVSNGTNFNTVGLEIY